VGWLGLRTLTVKFSTRDLKGEDQMDVEDWVLEDIRKDRDNGAVTKHGNIRMDSRIPEVLLGSVS